MKLSLTARTRVKKGGWLGHAILVDDGTTNFLLASQPCSVLADKCQTIEVELDNGPTDLSLCGEHLIALKVLQRQSEIDRGPEGPRPEQCFSGKASEDTPGSLGEFENSLIGTSFPLRQRASYTSHIGSATAVETETRTEDSGTK